jgi:hypothetical protein
VRSVEARAQSKLRFPDDPGTVVGGVVAGLAAGAAVVGVVDVDGVEDVGNVVELGAEVVEVVVDEDGADEVVVDEAVVDEDAAPATPLNPRPSVPTAATPATSLRVLRTLPAMVFFLPTAGPSGTSPFWRKAVRIW